MNIDISRYISDPPTPDEVPLRQAYEEPFRTSIERKEIVDFISTTNDVDTVKRLLIAYPGLCNWDEFSLGEQLHCCIISLLVEAGMTDDQNSVLLRAEGYNDCQLLLAYLRDRPRAIGPRPIIRGKRWARCYTDIDPYDQHWRTFLEMDANTREMHISDLDPMIECWRTAIVSAQPRYLNTLALFSNPERYIRRPERLYSLSDYLDKRGIKFKNGRFYREDRKDPDLWALEDDQGLRFDSVIPLGTIREYVNETDSVHFIEQCALVYNDLFHDIYLDNRFRRPALIEALARSGCKEVTYTSHVCEVLYDTYLYG